MFDVPYPLLFVIYKTGMPQLKTIFVFSPDYWGDEIKQKENGGASETRRREMSAGK